MIQDTILYVDNGGVDMLIFQLVIFISIFSSCKISEKFGNTVTAFWVVFTLCEVFMPWLMVLQIIVIITARSMALGKL